MDSLVDFSPLDTSKCSVYTFSIPSNLWPNFWGIYCSQIIPLLQGLSFFNMPGRVANTLANSWIYQHQRNTP